MKEAIEYLIVGTLILVIISFIITQNLLIPSKATNQMSQERLRDEAERTLDIILTSPGIPSNWGDTYVYVNNSKNVRNAQNVQIVSVNLTRFGLADNNKPYSLSPTKISYLKYLSDTGQLSSQNIVKITGIDKPFYLKIIQALNITVTQISTTSFKIVVKTYNNQPAFNANVTGFLIYTSGTGNNISVGYYKNTKQASLDGTAVLTFPLNQTLQSWVLVVYVSWGLFRNVATYYNNSQQVINGYILGNSLILYMPSNETAARHVSENITVIIGYQPLTIKWDEFNGQSNNIINKGDKSILVIDLSEALSGTELNNIIFVAGGVRYRGTNYYTFIVFQTPVFPNSSSLLTLSLGNINNALTAYSVQRIVSISGMTYIVQFTLGES